MDLAEGIEAIRQTVPGTFPGVIIISSKEQALEEVNTPRSGQVIWSDGFKLENDRTDLVTIYRNIAGI